MLHWTLLQWSCNVILYAGPSGQLLYILASIPGWGDQRSTFPLSRCVVKNMGTEWWWLCLYWWRSPARTRLFPALRRPSQVGHTGQHRPLTSWIMHYGHTLDSKHLTVLLFWLQQTQAASSTIPRLKILLEIACSALLHGKTYITPLS